MRELKYLGALLAVSALGLLAAGCGDDDESSATTTTTTTAVESTTESTSTTGETTTSDDVSEASTPDDVFNACMDVIEGTAAENAGQAACEQARTAFENCSKQAEASGNSQAAEIAIKACQQAADQTVAALQAGG